MSTPLRPADEAALDYLLAHPKLRQALGRPVRTFGRCSGCGEYARCVEGVGMRYCEGCGGDGGTGAR